MIPAHEQRLRAERDAAVAEAAELRRQRDEHGAAIGAAIDAFHAAGILTFGTLAQGVEKLAGERDALLEHAEPMRRLVIESRRSRAEGVVRADPGARAALSAKTCAKCEETERALETFSKWVGPNETVMREGMQRFGLWRDPAPARADEGGA